MPQTLILLQDIILTSQKTQETMKTIASYPEASGNAYIKQYCTALEIIKISGIKAMLEIVSQNDQRDLNQNILIILQNMASIDEIHGKLDKIFPCSAPNCLRGVLRANIQSLRTQLVKIGQTYLDCC